MRRIIFDGKNLYSVRYERGSKKTKQRRAVHPKGGNTNYGIKKKLNVFADVG